MLNTSQNKLQHDTLLERTRLPWTPEEGRRPFIGEGTLEGCDEGAQRSLGRGSKSVSFGECWTSYRYIQYIYVIAPLA